MPTIQAPRHTTLVAELRALVGAAHVLDDDADRVFYAHDIARAAHPVLCAVRPGTVDELARVSALVTGAGCALVPRGGGASYTGGYLADRPDAVVIDLTRLGRVVEINADDMYVTVECGCTWKDLNQALRPQGLRTPFWGPLSGGVATVGGSLSQHAILWGSARYGASAASVIGLDVVLGDGTLVRTGSGAVRTARPFFRHYGPDLTGVFLGDNGAFGTKARATLALIELPTVVETASFAFETADAMIGAMTTIGRRQLVSECFGMDPVLQYQRLKRAGLLKDLKALGAVLTNSGTLARGLREAARIAMAGRRFLDDVTYSVHLGTEGRDEHAVAAAMREVRQVVAAAGGREIENTVPKVMRSDPFVPMTSSIGPAGERWLPVHAVVRLSDAAGCWAATMQLFEEYEDRFARHGVDVGVLTAIIGNGAFVLEPVFYWRAPRTPFHERILEAGTLARFEPFAPNPEGEALVFEVRDRLTSLWLERGAVHLQIGRTYRYREGLRPEAWRLVEALKQATDPAGLVNPGVLGLGAAAGPATGRDAV